MSETRLVPILYVEKHDVRGEPRWTGRAELVGVMRQDVLILTVNGVLTAVRNRCPHRNVPILRGRLDAAAGTLECPSHGWELKLDGPELVGWPVVERDGALFLVLGPLPTAPCGGNGAESCKIGLP
ncbi:MAG TPA: Rieske 2Fe-2S domain-containing protein [Patescibacteria group bacterium]|nr:Rieske 2Fe-2S domain-containing protein [Patescibacteria group bacterium]